MSNSKIFVSALIILFINFFDVRGIDPTFLGWAKNALTLFFILMSWRAFSVINDKSYRFINISAILLCCVMFFLTYLAENSTYFYLPITAEDASQTMHLRGTFFYVLRILTTLFFIEYVDKEGKSSVFVRRFFFIYAAFVFIVDFEALALPHVDSNSYLNGNKFRVSYSNLYIAILYFTLNPIINSKNRVIFFLLLFFSILMSLYVGCITTIFACLMAYLLFFAIPCNKREKLYSPITFLLFLAVCDSFFFIFSSYIMEIGVVQDFIVNVLHKDLSLTGRLDIYVRLHEVLEKSPLWGFGIGNVYSITRLFIGAPNAQNGMLNLYIEIGLIGCVAFLLYMCSLLKKAGKLQSNYPVIVLIYTFVFVSSVEVPFGRDFIILCMLLILKDVGNAIPLFDIKSLFELIYSILETEDDEKTDKAINQR